MDIRIMLNCRSCPNYSFSWAADALVQHEAHFRVEETADGQWDHVKDEKVRGEDRRVSIPLADELDVTALGVAVALYVEADGRGLGQPKPGTAVHTHEEPDADDDAANFAHTGLGVHHGPAYRQVTLQCERQHAEKVGFHHASHNGDIILLREIVVCFIKMTPSTSEITLKNLWLYSETYWCKNQFDGRS